MADGRYEAKSPAAHAVLLDALNRAVRTWWQVVGAGILVAIGDLGLTLLATGDIFGLPFWQALLKGCITAVLAATFAYFSRFKAPPKTADQ